MCLSFRSLSPFQVENFNLKIHQSFSLILLARLVFQSEYFWVVLKRICDGTEHQNLDYSQIFLNPKWPDRCQILRFCLIILADHKFLTSFPMQLLIYDHFKFLRSGSRISSFFGNVLTLFWYSPHVVGVPSI